MRGTRGLSEDRGTVPRIIPAHAGNSLDKSGVFVRFADHPRACGELAGRSRGLVQDDGSSPRMRGTRPSSHDEVGSFRIIPAHAGNSFSPFLGADSIPDHPRACGELLATRMASLGTSGSSPRMRGTLRRDRFAGVDLRIIPAHAGNSAPPGSATRADPDHPRACGELALCLRHSSVFTGSSPRMRGTPELIWQRFGDDRIIPAHAGNSSATAVSMLTEPDHPRACGELCRTLSVGCIANGSSPRMRGTRTMRRSSSRTSTDHPRACGELSPSGALCAALYGSSPRMRGTLDVDRLFGGALRIIPAHAGNSCAAPSAIPPSPDHPRACGELFVVTSSGFVTPGSSPRMRGTQLRHPHRSIRNRIIPAHAGNSSVYRE